MTSLDAPHFCCIYRGADRVVSWSFFEVAADVFLDNGCIMRLDELGNDREGECLGGVKQCVFSTYPGASTFIVKLVPTKLALVIRIFGINRREDSNPV